MKVTILPAKFRVPPLPPAYLARPRLDRLWNAWSEKKLVLVAAGAGFGKTSFLAANAREGGRVCLWYTPDEFDADPVRFATHLASAIGALERPREEAVEAAGVEPGDRLLASLTRRLEEQGPRTALVLDDLQVVASSPEILAFLERLVRVLPEGNTLVLSSREPLGIATARLRSLGAVETLGPRELRFTETELEELFRRRFPARRLEPGWSRRIVAETEGWAAGIEILFQALASSSSWAVPEVLDRLASAGSGWFAYFAEEVVSRLDPRTEEFLLRSSVLPRLDPELCGAVLGVRGSREILERLSRRNLFTFPVGDGSYRYHHVFHEFLRDRLLRRADAAEIRRLRFGAARALAKAGAWAEAAAAYAEGGDPRATVRIVERFGESLLESGQYRIVRRAFDSIPADLLRKNAGALSVLGRLHEIQGRWEEARASYEAALRLCRSRARRVELVSLLAQVHFRYGDASVSESLCRKAIAMPGARSPRLRAPILCLLGLRAAEKGRFSEAEGHFLEAYRWFRHARDPGGQWQALMLLATQVRFFRGEFRKARDLARQALVIAQRQNDRLRIGHALCFLGFLALTMGEEREARDLAGAGLRIAEELEHRVVEGACLCLLGKCDLLTGDADGCREHLERARRIAAALGGSGLRVYHGLGSAELALAEGNRHIARAAATEAYEITRRRRDLFHEAVSCALLGLVESGARSARARAWWRRADRLLRRMGAAFEFHRLLLLRLDSGDVLSKEAPRALQEILAGAARMEHECLFLAVEPERAARVLPAALRLGIEVQYVRGLLVRMGPRVVRHLAPLAADPSDEVRRRAVEALAQIGGDEARGILARAADETTAAGRAAAKAARELEVVPKGPLGIRALGSLVVTVGDREISAAAWRSGRALRLFQLLLVHRFRWVPKDVVLETLWPEAERDKSEVSLRQSIHLLRKVLEPEAAGGSPSPYVRFHNELLRLDPGRKYGYDVEAFEETLERAARLREEGQRRKAEGSLRAALDLYRGAFLEESPYEEFTAAERERLQDRFLWAVGQLQALCAAEGRWAECIPLSRRGLAIDSFSEDLHRYLVRAHLELGNRQEALAAYRRYEEMMTRELDLPPSPGMRTLAERVVALAAPARDVSPKTPS